MSDDSDGWGGESSEYRRGQRDAIATLLNSPYINMSVAVEIRHAVYEERSIPKAVVDDAIDEARRMDKDGGDTDA